MKQLVRQDHKTALNRQVFGFYFLDLLVIGLAMGAIMISALMLLPSQSSAKQVEQIVHDYLMREPQLIYDALEELQQREQAEKLEKMNLAVLKHQNELYSNPSTPVGGNTDGDVTLVEFFDYRCGYCRHVMPSVEALLKHDKGVKLVFKDLPILGEESERAARAALASRKQGAYEQFHFALMQADDLSEAGIVALAEANSLDAKQLLKDMTQPDIDQVIDDNRKLAEELGVDGTPMFIIGNKVIPGAADLDQLKNLVKEARESGRSRLAQG